MPASQQSRAKKIALPILAVVIMGGLVIGSSILGSNNKPQSQQQGQQSQETDPQPATDGTAVADDDTAQPEETQTPATDAADDNTASDATEAIVDAEPPAEIEQAAESTSATDVASGSGIDSWSVRLDQPLPASWSPIGSADPESDYKLELAFHPAGAGLERVTLTDHYMNADAATAARQRQPGDPVEGQYAVTRTRPGSAGIEGVVDMLSATAVWVRDAQTRTSRVIPLSEPGVWRETAPGAFEATVTDGSGAAVLIATRAYRVDPGSYEMTVDQRLENRSGRDLEIAWYQFGPGDLPPETAGYRLETRRLRVGYTDQGNDQFVLADSELREVSRVANNIIKKKRAVPLWPSTEYKNAGTLAWVGQTNRHFIFAVHNVIDRDEVKAGNRVDKTFTLGAAAVETDAFSTGQEAFDNHVVTRMQSSVIPVAAGATADLSFAGYFGPLDGQYLSADKDPVFGALSLSKAVVYQIGFCGICTFQPISRLLLWMLRLFEGNIVFDFGFAIILLVICVRAVLHPITKKSQISMMRFSKQMQRIAPMQKKIQERYGSDKKRAQEEMMKLWREEGVNPAGMLGCLPMLLQTPIWIALYALIYFLFDLRHEPAFFGFFQSFGGWTFLNDLSSPDHFIEFAGGFDIPFISGLMGTISGFNILPILMGVVFFIQQKYMTPPPSPSMTPEQRSQQRLMKIMLVGMMPIFMYNAPAGLTLYIMTSSTLGILESRYIRSHVDKMDLEPPKKKPAPSGGVGHKRVVNTARKAEPRKRFKDRGKG